MNRQHHTVASKTKLGQSIKEGFGLGVGSAVAQRVVTGILGPPRVVTETVTPASTPTLSTSDLWIRCLEQTQGDVEKCEPLKKT